MAYLTPAQFRAMNFGVDTSGFIDVELAAILSRASNEVNSYCAAPTLPVPHDFRGGSITGETHTWHVDAYGRTPTRRVFIYHRPLIEITLMRIYVTKTQYLDVSAAELYYEPTEGWVEPTSANLTSYGLFGATSLPFVGLDQPHSLIDYTYGRSIPTLERIYYSETNSNTWRASIGWWASLPAPKVYVNDVERTIDFTVDRTEGTVTFTDAPFPIETDTIDVSFAGTLHPDVALATGLIAAERVSSRELIAGGFPSGIRRLKVAEVEVERDLARRGADTYASAATIPPEARDLLDPFIFRSLAFA